jgi:hypothetical protein
MKTKSENLLDKVGHKVECDICHKRKEFTDGWMMSMGKIIICPECQPKQKGLIMVSIV